MSDNRCAECDRLLQCQRDYAISVLEYERIERKLRELADWIMIENHCDSRAYHKAKDAVDSIASQSIYRDACETCDGVGAVHSVPCPTCNGKHT